MTRFEISDVLNTIMRENNFSILERDNCHTKNKQVINSMQKIFELKSKYDYTCLYAIADLLSDNCDNVFKYLLDENKYNFEDVIIPTRQDKLLVATALEENLEFFSMAYNWVSLVEARIESSTKKEINTFRTYGIVRHIEYIAASTPGWKLLGDENGYVIPSNIGRLYLRCSSSEFRLEFIVSITSDYVNQNFDLEIGFSIGDEEKRRSIIISHNKGEEANQSEVIENVDLQHGISNLTVKIINKED